MDGRIYELLFIVPADMEEGERQALLEQVEKTVREHGELHEMKEWRKRRLAYPIKRVTEGIYYLIYFSGPSGNISRIDMRLNQMEHLVRHVIVRIDEDYRKAKLPIPFQAKKESETPASEEVTHE
ncbi:MAG TPA: 30S ribosomal protein S6 [Thermoanaerobaculia bacterium]|nr:30S ribosomal protein S6 [Thermoanaerobaculia bacterium]HUM31008.1 30S ribosomal protein S6 [Thermoanaerobaculia bacterium]HXK69306.1 30S ribosomal protein S6 [Thermoanaerobaculia bacterium]